MAERAKIFVAGVYAGVLERRDSDPTSILKFFDRQVRKLVARRSFN